MHMKVRDVMTSEVASVNGSTPFRDVAEVLIAHEVSAVPVVDGEGHVIGVVSEADLLRDRILPDPRELIHDRPPSPPPEPAPEVAGVMTTTVVTATPDTHAAHLGKLMVERHLRAIPVVDGDRLVGIVSRVDVLRTIARDDEAIARGVAAHLAAAGRRRWDVEVADGVVSLACEGADETDRHVATVVAGCTPGVVGVRIRDEVASGAAQR